MIDVKKKHYTTLHIAKGLFWFFAGAVLGLFLFLSFLLILFQELYAYTVYPGVTIENIDFGNKTKEYVRDFFAQKNKRIQNTNFTFFYNEQSATVSAKELNFGYNEDLLADQAYSIGRTKNGLADISLIAQSYLSGLYLEPTYRYDEKVLDNLLKPIKTKLEVIPVDALFTFENGKVTAFGPSHDGQMIDTNAIKERLYKLLPEIASGNFQQEINIPISLKILKPKVSTDKVNNLGIKEVIGSGSSMFGGSISNRIYNVTLGASRLNGILVEPGEVFSFNTSIGDVSSFTGYKQAYVIKDGRTILGDGGGVCQVSTTLFRAVLNAGLPIIERQAHAYRPHYYELDSKPGLDATVYGPSVDFKFKNDTDHYILIQTNIDNSQERLTFLLYGTRDNRQVTLSEPLISSQTPPPEPLYQDDPNVPKGQIKQVDFAAWGAKVSFARKVIKNGKIYISETFASNYRPWQAVYLRGTKE